MTYPISVIPHHDNTDGQHAFDVDNDAGETEMIVTIFGENDPELHHLSVQIDTMSQGSISILLNDSTTYRGDPDIDEYPIVTLAAELRDLITNPEYNAVTRGAIETLLTNHNL